MKFGHHPHHNKTRPVLNKRHSSMFEFPSIQRLLDTTASGSSTSSSLFNSPNSDQYYNKEVQSSPGRTAKHLDLIKLNVGGRTFITKRLHFKAFPQTRLGKLVSAYGSQILNYCDSYHPGQVDPSLGSYDKPIPTYFFDHSGRDFEMILDLYRFDKLAKK